MSSTGREVYECALCNSRSPSLTLWMSHVRLVHVSDTEFRLSCPVQGCCSVYSKVNSICSHIYRKHMSNAEKSSGETNMTQSDESFQATTSSGVLMDVSLPESISYDVDKLLHRDGYEQKKKSSLFLLKLKEERMLTQVALNDVVSGCREVFQHTVCRLKAGVSHSFAQYGVESTCIDEIDSVFDEACDPFAELETAYLQDKFIAQELGCIVSLLIMKINCFYICMQEPIEVAVGPSKYVTRQSGAKRRKVLSKDTFHYVPILSTLKQILALENVRCEILRQPQLRENVLGDFFDGEIYKTHDLFKNNPHGLQIIAYYDEVETCNVLGSPSGKYKLGCVFFTLGNIRPLHRSALKSIFLAKSTTIKANGMDSILKPFIDDLKTLYDVGIKVTYGGNEEIWNGALLVFLADNLAAHELGGFKESFSFARRFCRSCLTNKEYSQSHFRDNQFTLRDKDAHRQHCSQLNGLNRMNISIEYGINRQSSLDSLPNFSVVEGLPHDIMHDLFEGVVPYELKLLLHHCICKSYFNVDIFNHRLSSFDFGYTEIKDKPVLLHDKTNIRQTASQMWLLVRILPILLGDLIPRDDTYWKCFLKLLNICEICVSPELSIDTIAYLELLIEEHHEQFSRLYQDKSIIPKMHFMVHYPQQILKYGPLIHSWTMRHEAKLRVIKRAARVSNFKNVCQTVAKRHQHLLCYYIHSSLLLGKPPEMGPCKDFTCPESIKSLLARKNVIVNDFALCTASYVTLNGVTYKPNAYILLHFDSLSPRFGKITVVIKTKSPDIILVVDEYETEYYDSHYRAYCISSTMSKNVYQITELRYNHVFHARHAFECDEKIYITLKCHLESD